MLTVVLLGLGSNLGEDMDVCKRIVPFRHGGTLNSSRVASPLVRLVEGEERLMAQKLFAVVKNECALESADSLMNQEVLTPGIFYLIVLKQHSDGSTDVNYKLYPNVMIYFDPAKCSIQIGLFTNLNFTGDFSIG
ncbi:hypothetical protein TNCV_1753861 [Trichonephila clavipes]|nr:hypothetical protein TNCV_1753861 [Trichonephila clavipes]